MIRFSYPKQTNLLLKSAYIATPIGSMHAIADENYLYFLEFADRNDIENKIAKLQLQTNTIITQDEGEFLPIHQIKQELKKYFDGVLKEFKTPLQTLGSHFQKLVWQELINIPYGKTKSYTDQAIAVGKQKAFRAVANANGANKISIVIPCHRIINKNGDLGGYGGGIDRKKWLLEFESKHIEQF